MLHVCAQTQERLPSRSPEDPRGFPGCGLRPPLTLVTTKSRKEKKWRISPAPKVKKSRALGIALTPKAVKSWRPTPCPPWRRGRGRKQNSDYKVRLLEKQRLRAQYDVSERQLVRAYERASKVQGKTGEALIIELERRLDALVLRSGIAPTRCPGPPDGRSRPHRGQRPEGRQAILRCPSPDDVVMVRERSRSKTLFEVSRAGGFAPDGETPRYLQVNLPALAFRLDREPNRKEIPVICDEQLVVVLRPLIVLQRT